MQSYEQLLDRLYEKLPKKVIRKERWEPPTFESMIQGNQTVIKNLGDVAQKLRREPQHVIKFLSKEFATAGNINEKRGLLQGKFKNDQLNSRLTKYINEYVLCNECHKPDTDITTFEGAKYKRCEVCGARAPVKAL